MLENFGRTEVRGPSQKTRSGCLTGCLGVVALLASILTGSALYQHFTDPTPKAAHFSERELLGTWKSPSGGILTLRGDGTFSAVDVCGFGTSNPQVGSDSGTWHLGGTYSPYSLAPATDGMVLFGATGQNNLYEGRDNNAPVLWEYVGPPQEPEGFCKLHKQ